ncbi:MAG TPA: FHA domain-containing protein [Ktedonobacteraceae bacterium]|jgi:pSer/pThr/pTyr-binding forkhead associated (FHA) protein
MLAIALNALYTTLCRRGTTRQLAGAIVSSVVSALLLLPALLWYNLRFSADQAAISEMEVGLVLLYVALCGWVAPFGITTVYCLFTEPRDSNTAGRLPGQRKSTKPAKAVEGAVQPPRRQPGVPAPFVYSADKPWGWLVYRNGNFTGQELALKHSIISIGREEDNEVWLDDDTISRYHAELAWDKGQVYVTDNDSLNGVLINGQRIRSSVLLKPDDELEIGGHRFILKHAQQQSQEDLSDPLLPQVRRRVQQRSSPGETFIGTEASDKQPAKPTVALNHNETNNEQHVTPIPDQQRANISRGETMQLFKRNPLPERPPGLCIIRSGEMAGRSFLLDRYLLTLGRGSESDIIIPDASISRAHIQFARQPEGDYVRDQGSHNGTYVNGQLLQAPRLLYAGDSIIMGDIQLEYRLRAEAQTPPPLPPALPPGEAPLTFPFTLRLPSRMKD